jgi:hypothetical protein
LDDLIKNFGSNPAPNQYRSVKEGMFGEFDEKEYEKKRSRSSDCLRTGNRKANRGTFIDEILKK